MGSESIIYQLATGLLRVALVFALFLPGWAIYRNLPASAVSNIQPITGGTTIQVILRNSADGSSPDLDIKIEFYPVDIVAVRHEYFTERRPGKRFDDFLQERMRGRTPISTRLDKEGQGAMTIPPGTWWLHAVLSGDEDLEWRLPVKVGARRQTIELTPQNAYARMRSF